ncbi:MAG: translation initiation factor IF-2 [Myxococcota bacterium]
MKNTHANNNTNAPRDPKPVAEEPKSSIASSDSPQTAAIEALGSSVGASPRVRRNADGVIVGTTARTGPKILGFIDVSRRTKALRAKRGADKGTRGADTKTIGRATLRNTREARLRTANRKNAARSRAQRNTRRTRSNTAAAMRAEHQVLKVDGTIAIAELAHALSQTVTAVVRRGWQLGLESLHPGSRIDAQDATVLAEAFEWRVVDVSFDEADLLASACAGPAEKRAPVVTVMGHVDHGKTSLLDKIRNARVADGEAGGITQHVGAYRIGTDAGDLVVLDTPGHGAFEMMRARGAQVTDIVVLVVAADDGVMPTTVEAIGHARRAGTPIVVAINKMDKPSADAARVRRELMAHGVVDEALGGDTPTCMISAKTGEGLDALLQAIALQSDLMELEAPREGRAHGVVLEGRVRKGHGPTCTVLVQDGTLAVGDIVVAGSTWGRVRRLLDDAGVAIDRAGPSTPVTVVGLSAPPRAGEHAVAVACEADAKRIVEHRRARARRALAPTNVVDIEAFRRRRSLTTLPVLIKADVAGSAEALSGVLESLTVAEVNLQVVDAGVGAISEGDVKIAAAAGALIVGFNVKADRRSADLARRQGVALVTGKVIYELADAVRGRMAALRKPELVNVRTGSAVLRQCFALSGGGVVAGCRVTDGVVAADSTIRVMRDGEMVFEGPLRSLRIGKEHAPRVRSGYECGMLLGGFDALREGDVLEAFETREVMPELS